MKKIGFAGLGIMGKSMAKNLLKGGVQLKVYNRSEAPLMELQAEGAMVAGSPAELALDCEQIHLCLSNEAVVEKVLEEILSSPSAKTKRIVDHSTISPKATRRFADRAQKNSVTFIDAPMSGGDVGAKSGKLSFMVGGNESDFQEIAAELAMMGKLSVHVGPTGSGQLTKCVNQVMVAIGVAAMTEGFLFAEKSGLSLETTLNAVRGGAAGSWSLDNFAPRVLRGDFKPGFYARDMLKDLNIVLEEARDLGIELPVASLVTRLYGKLCNSEGAELGNHALCFAYPLGSEGI